MSVVPSRSEQHNVTLLPGPARYSYFINRIVDWEEVWSIGDEKGWVLTMIDDESLIPIWPAASYAHACCDNEWASCEPRCIPLQSWLDKWIPGMIADSRNTAVFPIPSGNAVVVSPSRLKEDILLALEQYE